MFGEFNPGDDDYGSFHSYETNNGFEDNIMSSILYFIYEFACFVLFREYLRKTHIPTLAMTCCLG